MAESGGVSEILGAGSEAGTESSVAETPVDPTAAALAAEAAKSDPELAREASAYFRRQSHLIEVQTEHLHEQRAVNLSLLKLKRFDERLKVGLRVFVILQIRLKRGATYSSSKAIRMTPSQSTTRLSSTRRTGSNSRKRARR